MREPGDTVYTLSTSREGVTVRRGTVRYVERREGLSDDGEHYERTVYGVRFDGGAFYEQPYPIDEAALLNVSRYGYESAGQIGDAVLRALDSLAGVVAADPPAEWAPPAPLSTPEHTAPADDVTPF